jgi:hypothetical protein
MELATQVIKTLGRLSDELDCAAGGDPETLRELRRALDVAQVAALRWRFELLSEQSGPPPRLFPDLRVIIGGREIARQLEQGGANGAALDRLEGLE